MLRTLAPQQRQQRRQRLDAQAQQKVHHWQAERQQPQRHAAILSAGQPRAAELRRCEVGQLKSLVLQRSSR
jgi:DNA-binding helix-hairpin-helix protein with protein kinase domain